MLHAGKAAAPKTEIQGQLATICKTTPEATFVSDSETTAVVARHLACMTDDFSGYAKEDERKHRLARHGLCEKTASRKQRKERKDRVEVRGRQRPTTRVLHRVSWGWGDGRSQGSPGTLPVATVHIFHERISKLRT